MGDPDRGKIVGNSRCSEGETMQFPFAFLLALAVPMACWAQDQAAFSPDSKSLALLDMKGKIRIWEADTGKEQKSVTFPCAQNESVEQVRYLPNGELAVLLSRYYEKPSKWSAYLWNLSSGQRSPRIEMEFEPLAIRPTFAICPKGKVLAGNRTLWEISTGKKLRETDLSEGFFVVRISFSPGGKYILYQHTKGLGEELSMLSLVDIVSGKKLLQIGTCDIEKPGQHGWYCGPILSPDEKIIAFSNGVPKKCSIHWWEVASGKPICPGPFPVPEYEDVVGFSLNNQTLVTRWSDDLRLWETETGRVGHTINIGKGIGMVLLSPDGKTVALVKGNNVEFRVLK